MFVDRKEELKMLEDSYKNDSYDGIVTYGRRRIGKSELIKVVNKLLNKSQLFINKAIRNNPYKV